MAGGAETSNIAAPPAIARLAAPKPRKIIVSLGKL